MRNSPRRICTRCCVYPAHQGLPGKAFQIGNSALHDLFRVLQALQEGHSSELRVRSPISRELPSSPADRPSMLRPFCSGARDFDRPRHCQSPLQRPGNCSQRLQQADTLSKLGDAETVLPIQLKFRCEELMAGWSDSPLLFRPCDAIQNTISAKSGRPFQIGRAAPREREKGSVVDRCDGRRLSTFSAERINRIGVELVFFIVCYDESGKNHRASAPRRQSVAIAFKDRDIADQFDVC